MIVADESNNSIACWDTRTTEKQKNLTSGKVESHIKVTHLELDTDRVDIFYCFYLQVTTITFAVSPTHPRERLLSRAVMTSERGFGIVRECRASLSLQ